MHAQLIPIIAPVMICTAIGYFWARLGRPFDTQFIGSLVLMLGTPCLIFSTVVKMDLKIADFGAMSLMAFGVISLTALVAWPILKAAKLSVRGYLPPVMMPNAGNVGLPLCMFAFGDVGLAYGTAFFIVASIMMFTVGLSISAGSFSLREVFRIPVIYAVVAAFAFTFTGTAAPVWIVNTTSLIGGITIPLMLITLGISLAQLKVTGLYRSLVLSTLRISAGFLIALAFAEVFDLDRVSRGVLILQSSMPVAIFTYVIAERYKTEPEDVAGMAVISTFLMFVILTPLLWFVL
jgi:malate permease and related proteins